MYEEEWLAQYSEKIEAVYRQRTPKCRYIVERVATKCVPDGDYRRAIWFKPYPAVMVRGDGE